MSKNIIQDNSYSANINCSQLSVNLIPKLLSSIALNPELRFTIIPNLVSKAGFGKTYSVLSSRFYF